MAIKRKKSERGCEKPLIEKWLQKIMEIELIAKSVFTMTLAGYWLLSIYVTKWKVEEIDNKLSQILDEITRTKTFTLKTDTRDGKIKAVEERHK